MRCLTALAKTWSRSRRLVRLPLREESARGSPILTVMKTIAHQEGDARLDYASIDGASRRLYVARGFGVTAVDLDSGQVTRQLVAGQHVHAVIPLPAGRALVTNGDANTATLFEAGSNENWRKLPHGCRPGCSRLRSDRKRSRVRDGWQGWGHHPDRSQRRRGARPPDGRWEAGVYAVVDGHGRLFVNIEDQNKMAVIDTVARRVLGRYDLAWM